MTSLASRPWVPADCETYIQRLAASTSRQSAAEVEAALQAAIDENRTIHEADCINLNPATNVMNPKAEAALASGLGSRPSLGYPGDKYEMGLEGVEKIEVIAAELAAEVFGARYAEIRVPSGAIANLYAFMVAAKAGDCIIAPPASIGGHVTHHLAGCAGHVWHRDSRRSRRCKRLHGGCGWSARIGAQGQAENDHHRLKPEPAAAPDPRDTRDCRRGRRAGAVRCSASVRHDCRPCLATAAGGRRASDDDVAPTRASAGHHRA